ncbi:hypothetical protein AX15_006343 [Amanita polypyramis BW_CC]|nr:hypothetical protein AX15_006343 [Amanita polypyramis BW_CC]
MPPRAPRLSSAQSLPSPVQDLSHVFFFGASLKEASTSTITTKEPLHQSPTPTQRSASGVKPEAPAQDYTTIPNPIPDTGTRPVLAQVSSYPSDIGFLTSTGIISITAAGSASTPLATSDTHLFPLSSPTTAGALSLSPLPLASGLLSGVNTGRPSQQHSLPSTAIALLALGATCLVLSIFILVRACTHPKRHPRLTPSLPILDDEYFVDDLESKESPIFGGKERLSPKLDINDAWMSQCYVSQSSALPWPAEVARCGADNHTNDYGSYCRSPRPQDKMLYPDCSNAYTLHYSQVNRGLSNSSSLKKHASSICQPPYQQVQNAITQTIKRLSTVSLSLYQGTPRTHGEVGVALGGQETPLTGDGYSIMVRSRSKNLKSKDHQSRQSHGLVYDGVEDDFPSAVKCDHTTTIPQSIAQGGRTRIKTSYYAPGIYSRISTIPTSATKDTLVARANAPVSETTQKSDSRRERDTRSLTRALGLATPSVCEVLSPPLTLYPDDSLSVVDNKHGIYEQTDDQVNLASPPLSDPGAALGTLLLSDGPHSIEKVTNSHGDALIVPGVISESGKKAFHERRTSDKPPRVPSPPPLPSLAQMAMEHHNREDFENYRSPTYSIYGLYGGDRKSYGVLYR